MQVNMRLKMWEPIVQAMAAFKSSNVEDKLGLISQLGDNWICKIESSVILLGDLENHLLDK